MRSFSRQDELEEFKSRINLCEYATSIGYVIDAKQSGQTSAVLKHPNGDKLVVARGANRHWKYFNVHDDRDQGTIIDFIQLRDRCSIGEVRKRLREWVGKDLSVATREYQAAELIPAQHDLKQVLDNWNKATSIKGLQEYLERERHIPNHVLNAPLFKDRIRVDHRKNVLFVHYNQTGICGYEVKNRGFTGFSPGGVKGAFCSRPHKNDNELIICETAIDLLSYATLFGTDRKRFISTAGQISPLQQSLLLRAAERMPPLSKIVLAMDNDEAGQKLAQKISGSLQSAELSNKQIVYQLPTNEGEDWNDVLRNSPRCKEAFPSPT